MDIFVLLYLLSPFTIRSYFLQMIFPRENLYNTAWKLAKGSGEGTLPPVYGDVWCPCTWFWQLFNNKKYFNKKNFFIFSVLKIYLCCLSPTHSYHLYLLSCNYIAYYSLCLPSLKLYEFFLINSNSLWKEYRTILA